MQAVPSQPIWPRGATPCTDISCGSHCCLLLPFPSPPHLSHDLPLCPPQRLRHKNNMDRQASLIPCMAAYLPLSGFRINFSCSPCPERTCTQGCLFRLVFQLSSSCWVCCAPQGWLCAPCRVTAAAQQPCGCRLTCRFFVMPSQRTWSWRPLCKQNKRGGHSSYLMYIIQ